MLCPTQHVDAQHHQILVLNVTVLCKESVSVIQTVLVLKTFVKTQNTKENPFTFSLFF